MFVSLFLVTSRQQILTPRETSLPPQRGWEDSLSRWRASATYPQGLWPVTGAARESRPSDGARPPGAGSLAQHCATAISTGRICAGRPRSVMKTGPLWDEGLSPQKSPGSEASLP